MLKAYTATDIGKRTNNEDSLACLDNNVLVIADGMGGYAAGEIASRMLVDTVRETMESNSFPGELVLKKAIMRTNEKIIQEAEKDKALKGMGTTASVCQIYEDKMYWAHVGDSRIYLFHEGTVRQITRDHSLVFDLVEEGSITLEQARNHPQRNLLTRAVGAEELLLVDTGECAVAAGDYVVLCTDGLSAVVSDEEMLSLVMNNKLEESAQILLERALSNGSTDNISVIVSKVFAGQE